MSKAELMEKIAGEIKVCVKCPLWRGRRNAVPGEGNIDTTVIFVGEAPGYWEDARGLPFVGAAGKILDSLLQKIGLPRASVFITSVVKCRPPANREPRPMEIVTCTSEYLTHQIALVQPKIAVTLGRHSTAYILSRAGFGKVESITQLRGEVFDIEFYRLPLRVIPMYHPAAVLHNPSYRDELVKDFELLKSQLQKSGFA